ncbi:ABC-2 type transport system permease protein [Salirhabdus euzebyi]|uniref:ABC-2 type transport system permease protein n=1 Tax=Salirhabdus euzebyi TaxID=394506 RepID=A0A841Q7W5_9BACI|nr:ABC transporter permease [Salirhabdus euzebyi]MBB6454679.1 ABC-2 type transport system permease protein [Salirhabdus euzebyi]
MFNASQLWRKRLGQHAKETGRYLRLMFNDHLAFALLFFVAAFAYFYQQWLQTIPDNFPADWIIAIVLGALLTRSPIRTLLKEADTVFLLPAEYKMDKYFQRSFWYSFMIQLYIVTLALAALTPLYFAVFSERPSIWLLYLGIILVIFKIWNLLSSWWMLKERDANSRFMDMTIRLILNILTLFFFLQEDGYIYASITTVMFVLLLLYTYNTVGKKGIAWDLLIEKEDARMQAFYRLANMFTDVPHLRKKAKKRHLLVHLLTRGVPFNQKNTYTYLYRITFVRSSDYLGMYVRLFLLAIFFIFWIPNIWFKLAFALLFIYLSGFQLMTLWNHHRTIAWIDLYPVSIAEKKRSLVDFLLLLMLVKTLVLGIFLYFAASWQEMLMLWGVGGLFSFVFVETYVKKRLDKRLI